MQLFLQPWMNGIQYGLRFSNGLQNPTLLELSVKIKFYPLLVSQKNKARSVLSKLMRFIIQETSLTLSERQLEVLGGAVLRTDAAWKTIESLIRPIPYKPCL